MYPLAKLWVSVERLGHTPKEVFRVQKRQSKQNLRLYCDRILPRSICFALAVELGFCLRGKHWD